MRRTTAFVGASVAASAFGAAALGQQYQAIIIEALDRPGSISEAYLFDVNELGEAVGFMTHTWQDDQGSFHTEYFGYTWTESGGVNLRDRGTLESINDLGDVTGNGVVYLADGGTLVVPGLPGALAVWTHEINNDRVVAADSIFRIRSGSISREATVWSQQLGLIGLETDRGISLAHSTQDINEHNEVAGLLGAGTFGAYEPFYYDVNNDVYINIGALLASPNTYAEASSINNLGVVAGHGWHTLNGPLEETAWIFDAHAREFTVLPGLNGGDPGQVLTSDINDRNQVVGQAGPIGAAHAFLWDAAGGMRDLNDLATGIPDGYVLENAYDINDRGMIVGFARGPEFAAFVLIPACEADLDGDGDADVDDFFAYLDLFAAGDAGADVDGDGDIDADDFFAFLDHFAAGCS